MRAAGWARILVLLPLLAPPLPAAAQQASRLDQVDELARMGRTADARDLLGEWWEGEGTRASRKDVQLALWMRGRLSIDPRRANLDFRRLVVEFPGGPWSDQALLRLAQGAWAAGDSAEAAQDVARLVTEYPNSAARREAESWLAGAGAVPPPVRRAAGPEPEDASAGGVVDTRSWAVQLGAFSERERAVALCDRALEAGLQARLATVPGSPLVRVRVGRFDSAEEAGDILRRVREQGFTATLVKDAHLEGRSGR